MKQKLYQIDAFTERIFSGNPAAVCILDAWVSVELMQHIAAENNLAETAFAVHTGNHFEIRWFTPELEVDLCGHATLATAFVLFKYYGVKENTLRFISSRSGELRVQKNFDESLTLDFPTDTLVAIQPQENINEAIGAIPIETFKGKTDYLLIYKSQEQIEAIRPNFHLLNALNCRGVIVSSKGNKADFVSRFFAPQCGIPEDPVTGSAHTALTPYWSKKYGKTHLTAQQLSLRGGFLKCEDLGNRVKITGHAVCYLIGEIEL